VSLTADGQVGQTLREGDQVDVRRSERSVRLVHLPGYRYFAVLRQKLHWRGSNV
jgi:NAD+ kinase